MLGDETVFVESPHFTLRRLQLRHGTRSGAFRVALEEHLFPSTSNRDWGGLRLFNTLAQGINATAEAEAVERRASASAPEAARYVRRLLLLAPRSDAAASVLARLLVDHLFVDRVSRWRSSKPTQRPPAPRVISLWNSYPFCGAFFSSSCGPCHTATFWPTKPGALLVTHGPSDCARLILAGGPAGSPTDAGGLRR